MNQRAIGRLAGQHPFLVGTFLAVISAVAYTAANIYLRKVAVDCDPVWVTAGKVVPVCLAAWLVTAARWRRGEPVLARGRALAALVATGLFVQLAGNVAFQWSLGQVGLALAVPLAAGTVIVAGALLGRVWLGEAITATAAVAMLLLVLAIVVLSLGANDAHRSIVGTAAAAPIALLIAGVGAACLSGAAYATSGAVIRRVVRTLPVSAPLTVISSTGVVVLGGWALVGSGTQAAAEIAPAQWGDILIAGLFNAAAFFALGESLRLIPVVHVNAIEASQTAMAAGAGVLLFGEAATPALLWGAGLTVLGLLLMQKAQARRLVGRVAARLRDAGPRELAGERRATPEPPREG